MAEKIKATVMLIDNEKEFLDMLSQRLQNRGLNVDAVISGDDGGEEKVNMQWTGPDAPGFAVSASKDNDNNFRAIVVDLAMTGIDGIEILKRMKEKKPDLEISMLPGKMSWFWI